MNLWIPKPDLGAVAVAGAGVPGARPEPREVLGMGSEKKFRFVNFVISS